MAPEHFFRVDVVVYILCCNNMVIVNFRLDHCGWKQVVLLKLKACDPPP